MSNTTTNKTSLELSVTPAFFAAGCCATLPIMTIFGISLAQEALDWYQWYFRFGGVVLLVVALWWYFRQQGIVSREDYKEQRTLVLVITALTALYCVVIYLVFTKIITPILWYYLVGEVANCCSI